MSAAGPGELVEIGGRLNSEKYLEIIRGTLMPPGNISRANI